MKTILMTIGFVVAFGMIGGGIFLEMKRRAISKAADDRVDEVRQQNEKLYAVLNAPPALPDPKEVAVRELIRLRGKLATCATTSEACDAAFAIRNYAETIRDTKVPSEVANLIPSVMIGYDGQRFLDAHSELRADAALPEFQKLAKRLAAEIDAALPLLR